MITFEPGTVSHGTMRPQDLIPPFLAALRPLATAPAYDGLLLDWDLLSRGYIWHQGETVLVNRHDPELAAQQDALVERLFDALDAAAPDGYTFGAHPGDGSDYGFWPIEWFA